jgi:3-oxoacyl-(acyl-carrier-protein) synthase
LKDTVVITGMGAVSCLGRGLHGFWSGLVDGRSGIGPVRKFDASGIRNPEAGEVHDWPRESLPEWAMEFDEACQFALVAAKEAVEHAQLGAASMPDTGIVLATNFGGARTFEQWAPVPVADRQPDLFHKSLPPAATNAMAAFLGASGPRTTLSLSCSSGAAAIGVAADWIRRGRAQRIIAGGYDALSLYALAGLSCLRTVTTGKLQPFDKNRSGTVFGEGAGMLVLENLESAIERGVRPLAVLSGWAINNNAHHLTAPDTRGQGTLQAMRGACHDAGRTPDDIDYVNAHGTGTRYNDPAETAALHEFLGDRAMLVPVSSIKASISHTMGGAGALEAIATILSIETGIVPPTLNWQERDPDCDLDYVPTEARRHPVQCALSLSSGIGGNNAALFLESARQR